MTSADHAGLRPPRPGADEAQRVFVTPEGVDLQLRIAAYAERISALAIDMLILAGVLIALTLLVLVSAFGLKSEPVGEILTVVWLLGSFGLRYIYFLIFELRPGAATPGKRIIGLRVAARDGGRLTADAVFARNAMRELEVFLPLGFLFARGQGIDALLIGLGVVWSGVFLLFPLFNRDRLRLGDLAAGTMVVKAPRRVLRPDLAREGLASVEGVALSQAQLDAYGEKELKVLEEVLRGGDRRTMAEVARRIQKKIGWDGPTLVADRQFLQAYYTGLRNRLEARMLFGRRRRDKLDRG